MYMSDCSTLCCECALFYLTTISYTISPCYYACICLTLPTYIVYVEMTSPYPISSLECMIHTFASWSCIMAMPLYAHLASFKSGSTCKDRRQGLTTQQGDQGEEDGGRGAGGRGQQPSIEPVHTSFMVGGHGCGSCLWVHRWGSWITPRAVQATEKSGALLEEAWSWSQKCVLISF